MRLEKVEWSRYFAQFNLRTLHVCVCVVMIGMTLPLEK